MHFKNNLVEKQERKKMLMFKYYFCVQEEPIYMHRENLNKEN